MRHLKNFEVTGLAYIPGGKYEKVVTLTVQSESNLGARIVYKQRVRMDLIRDLGRESVDCYIRIYSVRRVV